MALRVSLPDEINPDEDWCIKVFIPGSLDYLRALRSVLTFMGHWYAWQRDDDKQGTLAARRWRQSDEKTVAALLAGEMCSGETSPITAETIVQAGIVIEGEEMGQVVTNWYIDEETGEFVVEFGPCCQKRFGMVAAPGGTFVDEQGEPPAEPDNPPTGEYSPCGKSKALYDVWVAVIDACLDAAGNASTPWALVNDLGVQFPSISFGRTALLTAYTAALSVVAQGLASETEDPDLLGQVLCSGQTYFEEGFAGCTYDQYRDWTKMVGALANKYFDVNTYPTAFGNMASVWFYSAQAIGDADAKDITTGAIDNGLDCCAVNYNPATDEDWYVDMDFTLNRFQFAPVSGNATYVAGSGWEGSEVNNGSYISIESSQLGDTAVSQLNFIRIEYTMVNGDGTSSGELSVTGENPAWEIPLSAFEAGGGVVQLQDPGGLALFAISGGDRKWTITLDVNENGQVKTVIKRIVMAGSGEKLVDDTPYSP